MPFLKRTYESRSNNLENSAKRNGIRHAIFTVPGDKYIGDWSNDKKEGKGVLLTRTRRLYEGDWQKDYRHGFGVLAAEREKIFILEYRGGWKNGLTYEFGARHYAGGGYYLGYWVRGKRQGYGQMWYADGAFYDGDWKGDLQHGLGMHVKPDGNRYEGAWANGMKYGKGRFFHLDSGQMQEGIWNEDVCVYSIIVDIPYRQSAVQPTPYPINFVEIVDVNDLCELQEAKALSARMDSCPNIKVRLQEPSDKI